MIVELDSIAETELVASSGYFAQLGNYIVDMLFYSKSLIGLEFLLTAYRPTTKSSA